MKVNCKKYHWLLNKYNLFNNNYCCYLIDFYSFFLRRESEEENIQHNICDRKFIVFESCLKELFFYCQIFDVCKVTENCVVGSMVCFCASCSCGSTRVWNSQPTAGRMPMGNFALAAVSAEFISARTYNYMQSDYLIDDCVAKTSTSHFWKLPKKIAASGRRWKVPLSMALCEMSNLQLYGLRGK